MSLLDTLLKKKDEYFEVPQYKASEDGYRIIKKWEKLKLVAYKPHVGDVWTIGWGTTRIDGRPVYQGQTITKEEAEKYFREDVARAEKILQKYLKIKLNQNQINALVSFVYNVGDGNFKSSTLRKKLNSKEFDSVPFQMQRWVHSGGKIMPGLIKRRAEEAWLFQEPIDSKEIKKIWDS